MTTNSPPSFYDNKMTEIRFDCYNDECNDIHYLCKCGIVYHDKYNMLACNHRLMIACKCGMKYYSVMRDNELYNIAVNVLVPKIINDDDTERFKRTGVN